MSQPIAPFPYGFPVEVLRSPPRNIHGDTLYVPVGVIEGCAWAPRFSDENNDARTSVIVGLTLYGPFGADLRFDDRVVLPHVLAEPADVKRRTYRVVGDPGQWHNPFTGWRPGFEAALERVT